MLAATRIFSKRILALAALSISLLALDASADVIDVEEEEAWRKAVAALVGRFVQYETEIHGRDALTFALVRSVSTDPTTGSPLVTGIRVIDAADQEATDQANGRLCSEDILHIGSILKLWVLNEGALVGFGALLEPELRERLHLPLDPDPRAPPPKSLLAELEDCGRRADKAPIQSITLHRREVDWMVHPDGRSKPLQQQTFVYGFDGAEHVIEEMPGEDWKEVSFSVAMRPGFPAGELTVENQNITVMHCSDEGGWVALFGWKTGATAWRKLERRGGELTVGPVRQAPFPPYTKAELDAANTDHLSDCRPVLGKRTYRVRYRGKTIKTIVIVPALGC